MSGIISFPDGMDKIETLSLLDKLLVAEYATGNIKYADINQVRLLLVGLTTGMIIPTGVQAGATLGSPAQPTVVYGSAGTYTLPTGNVTLTQNLNMFFWDMNQWTILQIPINIDLSQYAGKSDFTTLQNRFNSIMEPLSNDPQNPGAVVSNTYGNTVDLNTFTGSAQTNVRLFPKGTTMAGKMKQIQFWCVKAGILKVRMYRKNSNGSYTAYRMFDITATLGLNTLLAGSAFESFDVTANDYFAFFLTSTNAIIGYKTGVTGDSFALGGGVDSTLNVETYAFAASGLNFGLNFIVETIPIAGYSTVLKPSSLPPLTFGLLDAALQALINNKVTYIPGSRLVTEQEAVVLGEFGSTQSTEQTEVLGVNPLSVTPLSSSTNYCIIAAVKNFVSVQHAGKIKSVFIETGGANGTIAVIVMRNLGGGSAVYREVSRQNFETTIGANTYDLKSYNISVLPDDYIAFVRVNTSIYFYVRATQTPNPTADYFTPTPQLNGALYEFTKPSAVNGIAYRIVVNITYMGSSGTALSQKLTVVNKRLDSLESGSSSSAMTSLWNDNFQELLPNYTPGSWQLVAGGISPTQIGLPNSLVLRRNYGVYRRTYKWKIRFGDNTRTVLYNQSDPDDNLPSSVSCCMIEFSTVDNTVKLYDGYGNNLELQKPLDGHSYPFAFDTTKDYIVEVVIQADLKTFQVYITDTLSAVRTQVLNYYHDIQRWNDQICMASLQGLTTIIKQLSVSTPTPVNPFLMLFGDSITHGGTPPLVGGEGYSQMLVKAVGRGSTYSGRPSGQILGVRKRLISEAAILKPKYIMVTIGTNNDNAQVANQYPALINEINSLGAIPICNNIPMRGTNDQENRNVTIANLRGQYGIKGALLDVATAVNNRPSQGRNTSLYITNDVTHPNALGHIEMLKRFAIDVPEIFLNN